MKNDTLILHKPPGHTWALHVLSEDQRILSMLVELGLKHGLFWQGGRRSLRDIHNDHPDYLYEYTNWQMVEFFGMNPDHDEILRISNLIADTIGIPLDLE